jgi:hypothetical protein
MEKFNFHFIKRVSKHDLRNIWKKISDNPFSDLYAFIVEENEFLSTLKLLQKQSWVIDTRIGEYGIEVPNECIDGCTFGIDGRIIVI